MTERCAGTFGSFGDSRMVDVCGKCFEPMHEHVDPRRLSDEETSVVLHALRAWVDARVLDGDPPNATTMAIVRDLDGRLGPTVAKSVYEDLASR